MQWLAGDNSDSTFDLNSMMTLVKNIQSQKTAWMDKSFEDRKEIVLKTLSEFEAKLDELIDAEAQFLGVPVGDVQADVSAAVILIKSQIEVATPNGHYPRGVMLALTPKTYGLCSFLYMTLLGSLYGNSMIVKYKNAQRAIEILKDTELASYTSVLTATDEDAFEMLSSHPFLDSIVYMGQKQNFEKLPSLEKSVFASFDAINTHVVLKNADVKKASESIFKAFIKNKAISPIKPHRVLIAKAVFEDFKAEFMEKVKDLKLELKAPYKAQFEQHIEELRQDTHNLFYEAEGVYITADLTYCSTYQEKEILGGFLSLSEFKYNHEAAKWVNVSSRHRSVCVWTEDVAKAEKFMSKLHTPKVLVNKVSPESQYLPLAASGDGVKGGTLSGELLPEQLFAQKRIIENA